MVTKDSEFWWWWCGFRWRLRNVPILVVQQKQSLEKTGKRCGGGRRCENEPWPLPVCSPLRRLVLALITSIGRTELCRAQRQLLVNAVGLCFWKGAWSLLRMLKARCVSPGGKGWLSTLRCRYPVMSAVLGGCHWKPNSSIKRAGRNPRGMPAVILIKHMLPRGKTQPSFMKEGPNPALVPPL